MAFDCTAQVRAFYQAFLQREQQVMRAMLHPQVKWFTAEGLLYADHSPYVGPEAVRALIFDRMQGDWDPFEVTAHEMVGRDDLVIASGRFRGTLKRNGASVDAQLVQVFHFTEGLVSKVEVYTDTAQFKEAAMK